MSPKCPFCAVELIISSSGQSYNKLILQTDSGKEWTDVVDKDDSNSSYQTLTTTVMNNSLKCYNKKLFPKWCPQIGLYGI